MSKSKGEQRRLDLKSLVLHSPGLTVAQGLNECYGEDYNETKENAGVYAGCLKTAGIIPTVVCCICATCKCGPLKEIQQGFIGLLVEFGKLKAKLGPGLHTYNPCT